MYTPTKIKRLGFDGLEITWQSGEVHQISSKALRQNCPAADSKLERGDLSHDTPLTPKKTSLKVIKHDQEEQLKLKEIWGVGNYAIGIRWADGHDSGIYPYPLLYEIAQKEINQNEKKDF